LKLIRPVFAWGDFAHPQVDRRFFWIGRPCAEGPRLSRGAINWTISPVSERPKSNFRL